MSGLKKIGSLSNEEFKVCNVAIIECEGKKGHYVISRNKIVFPWSKLEGENLGVEIIKCKVGKKLEFKVFAGKNPFYIHKTLTVITSIKIDKE